MTTENKIDVIYKWVMAQKGELPNDIPEVAEMSYDEEIIEEVLTDIGVSRSLSGFRYTVWAVKEILANEHILKGIVKSLYVPGGCYFGITTSSFERSIRHAKDSVVCQSDTMTATATRLFGDRVHYDRIANKAFLATIASEVKKRKKLHKFDI